MRLTVALPHPLRQVTWAGAPTEPVRPADITRELSSPASVPVEEAQAREQAAYEMRPAGSGDVVARATAGATA